MANKYLVIRTTRNGVMYKKNKTIDGWTIDKSIAYKFSKTGAKHISERLNLQVPNTLKPHIRYNTLIAE